jgi:hypothetical protein
LDRKAPVYDNVFVEGHGFNKSALLHLQPLKNEYTCVTGPVYGEQVYGDTGPAIIGTPPPAFKEFSRWFDASVVEFNGTD